MFISPTASAQCRQTSVDVAPIHQTGKMKPQTELIGVVSFTADFQKFGCFLNAAADASFQHQANNVWLE